MKLFVTGGAGFLGSHLCRELINLNFNVICMDNLFTGEIKNISDLKNNSKFKFLEHDVTIKKNIRTTKVSLNKRNVVPCEIKCGA